MHHDASTSPPRIRALDGLRGLAVAGVLAYHCGFGWARGGFLGVSLFFTLSGFLITSLLLDEHASTGRIAVRRFWARRARRLLPAALVALAAIVVFGATVASGSQVRALRGDVLGALGYVANWRFVIAGSSYGDLWSAPSPVQHFWSLAIEEQLYVVLPAAVALALLAGRGRLRYVTAVVACGLAASVAATFLVTDQLRAYYGTDVRAAELLAGALLAIAVHRRPALRVPWVAGAASLVVVLVAWATMSQIDARLYDGGLLVHAALISIVIAAARTEGPLATALSARPLRWLGRVSYAAYLYHWPLFLWLDESRTGLHGLPLAVTRLGAALGAAALSTRFLEEPIRAGRRFTVRTAPLAFGVVAGGVAAALVVVTSTPPRDPLQIDFSAAPTLIAPPTVLASTAPSPTPAPAPADNPGSLATAAPTSTIPGPTDRPLRVYVAGDSNAYILGLKLGEWGATHGMQVWASGWFACHIVPGGTYRWAGQPKHTQDKCNNWKSNRAEEIASIKPDLVLIMYGSFDLLDRKWDGSDEWTHIGMPDFDRLLDENINEMTDVLGSTGAHVVWTTYPRVRTGIIDGTAPAIDWPEFASFRVDRLNTFIREAVARRPFASVLDVRRYMQAWPNGELDPVKRPDGIHPSAQEADILADWIGTQLLSDPSLR